MRFADPAFLLLLSIVPVYLYLYWRNTVRGSRRAAVRYSNLGLLRTGAGSSARTRFRHLPAAARASQALGRAERSTRV